VGKLSCPQVARVRITGRIEEVYPFAGIEESLRKSQRAIELTSSADDPYSVYCGFWGSLAMLTVGNLHQARVLAKANLTLAAGVHRGQMLAAVLWSNQLTAQITGDWTAACNFSNRGQEIWPMDPRFLGSRALVEYQLGSFSQGQAYMNQLVETMHSAGFGPSIKHAVVAITVALITQITGMAEELRIAKAAAETILSSSSATPLLALIARAGLAFLSVEQGDAVAAMQ
jgi:hypothetical protein